jgi:hypothetical protein
MNAKQEKYIKLLNAEIMNSIMKLNEKAAKENAPITLQTYILLIDVAAELASQLGLSKKDQISSTNHFIKQYSKKNKSVDIELNKKLSDSLDEENDVSVSMDEDEASSDDEISSLFSKEFETKKDCN